MRCQKCGTEIDTKIIQSDGTLRCPGCGVIYRRLASQNRAQSQQSPQPQVRQSQPAPPVQQPLYNTHSQRTVQTPQSNTTKVIVEKTRTNAKPLILTIAIIGMLVVAIITITNSGGGNPYAKQYELIERYESAYNKQDFYAMIQCFEPSATEFSTGLANLLYGNNASAYMNMAPYASELLGASGLMDNYFGKVNFTPYQCKVNGSEGVIAYHVEYVRDGKTERFNQAAAIKQVDGN